MRLQRGREYCLLPAEQALATDVAQKRWEANRNAGSFRPNKTGTPPVQHERDAVGAEIAFSRLVSEAPSTVPLVCERWVGTVDCVLPDGRQVDVKYTTYEDGCLLVPINSSSRPDVYVLMKGRFPRYYFAGWAPAALLRQDGHVTDRYGKGTCYRFPPEWLEDELI